MITATESHGRDISFSRVVMSQGSQTINVNDLDVAQLADVRKQLEEVGIAYFSNHAQSK